MIKPTKKYFDYKSRMHKFKHELKNKKTWANNMKKEEGSKAMYTKQGGLNGKQQHTIHSRGW
jgi:hypothetical protein